jgi:aryl-alcohol dehydrogenase-like predicted oxidoreductase
MRISAQCQMTASWTQDDLVRIYREKAKVSNPHLAQAIDAGVTLEDIAYDYRKSASEVLGVPLAGIPLTEDFIGTALKGGEPGKPRLMTTNEWKYQLKSNPDYGYQFTANARKEVNDIVSNLEKAFGFVR